MGCQGYLCKERSLWTQRELREGHRSLEVTMTAELLKVSSEVLEASVSPIPLASPPEEQ